MPRIFQSGPEPTKENSCSHVAYPEEMAGLRPERGGDFPDHPPSIDIRMLAHDLRTPISSAVLSLRIARDKGTPQEKADRALDLAEKSLEALQRIVDSLIAPPDDFGEALSLRVYDATELIVAAKDQVVLLAGEKNQALTVLPASIRQSVVCDGVRIVRVLVNLLSNAIRNTPAGGCISVSARRRHNDGHPVIVFSVCDNGPGVSPEIAQSIFEPGVSIPHDGRRSTGLGLAVCRKIVEAHHGRIWVELDRAEGAGFSFAIPLRERDVAAASSSS